MEVNKLPTHDNFKEFVKLHWPFLVLVGIFLVLVISLLIVNFLITIKSNTDESHLVENIYNSPTPTVITKIIPTTDPSTYNGWKSYHDYNLDIDFKYPDGVIPLDQSRWISCDSNKDNIKNNELCNGDYITTDLGVEHQYQNLFRILSYDPQITNNCKNNYTLSEKDFIIFNSVYSLKYQTNSDGTFCTNNNLVKIERTGKNSNLKYFYIYLTTNNSANLELAKQIIESISLNTQDSYSPKLLEDNSNYKIEDINKDYYLYTDKKLNITIKYPKVSIGDGHCDEFLKNIKKPNGDNRYVNVPLIAIKDEQNHTIYIRQKWTLVFENQRYPSYDIMQKTCKEVPTTLENAKSGIQIPHYDSVVDPDGITIHYSYISLDKDLKSLGSSSYSTVKNANCNISSNILVDTLHQINEIELVGDYNPDSNDTNYTCWINFGYRFFYSKKQNLAVTWGIGQQPTFQTYDENGLNIEREVKVDFIQ